MNILQIINLILLTINLILAFYIISGKDFQIKSLKEENLILRKELYKVYDINEKEGEEQ